MGECKKDTVLLHDKRFELFIPHKDINDGIIKVADRINRDYSDCSEVVFIVVLNGAFMFAAELLENIRLCCRVGFVRISSYMGLHSSGEVSESLKLDVNIKDKHVVILEDIVETGCSMHYLINELRRFNPLSVEIAALFFKPSLCKYDISVKYNAMELPEDFVVGFGLDYNGLGRNMKDIYRLTDEKH